MNKWKPTGFYTEKGELIYKARDEFAVEKDFSYLVEENIKECPKCGNPLALGSDKKWRHYIPFNKLNQGMCDYIEEEETIESNDYDKKMRRKQIEKLPVGTIYNPDASAEYRDVYIEIPKNSWWVHYYTQNGKAFSIPMIYTVIEWKKRWK